MSRTQLTNIEKIFDSIIRDHGIRPVSFDYVFSETTPFNHSEQDISITKLKSEA